MHTLTSRTLMVALAAALLTGCAGMSNKQKNAAAGAAIGGVAGAILTDGSALGTVGGAAIGGAIGHGTSK